MTIKNAASPSCPTQKVNNEEGGHSSGLEKKIVKLNEKIKKYEDIIEKKNKEITEMQMNQETCKLKL